MRVYIYICIYNHNTNTNNSSITSIDAGAASLLLHGAVHHKLNYVAHTVI